MHRPAFHSAVEIDDVYKSRVFRAPMSGGVQRIFKIHRFLIHLTLKQTDTTAVFEIDGRDDQHKSNKIMENGKLLIDIRTSIVLLHYRTYTIILISS